MKRYFITTTLVLLVFLAACVSHERSANLSNVQWKPWTEPVTNAEQLGLALESRWTLEMIRAYCNNVAPPPGDFQNLVALGEQWEGVLYSDKNTGLDRIWWYASLKNGKFDRYSLNASKGSKYWIIEIGHQETLAVQPRFLSKVKGAVK